MSTSYPVSKLRRAILHFAGGRVLQALARAALVLVVVRLLTTEDYGAYMLFVGVSEMLLQTVSLGILPVGQRFLPQLMDSAAPTDVHRFVSSISVLQFLVVTIVASLLWLYWDTILPRVGFDERQIEQSRPAILMLLLVPAFRFVADLLEALLEQGKAQVARALMPLGRLFGIGVVLVVGVEITLERILFIDGAVTAVCLLAGWLLMIHSLRKVKAPTAPIPMPVRAMVRHAWHMSAVDALGSTQAPGAIRIVLANVLGISESGLFAFLQSLQRLVSRYLPGVLLIGLIRPMMVSRVGLARGMQLLDHGTALVLKSNLLVIAIGAMVIFFGGDRIVELASGGRFTDAGTTLLLMLLILGVTSQRAMLEMLMQILNETRVLRATAILGPASLLLVWLAADYGLNAAIIVSASGVAIANIISMMRLRAATGHFQTDWRGTASIIVPAVIAALFGDAVQATLGTWAAVFTAGALLILLLAAAKPFLAGELLVADRGLGRLGRRILAPFTRVAAA